MMPSRLARTLRPCRLCRNIAPRPPAAHTRPAIRRAASSSSASPPPPSFLRSPWRWYVATLDAHPLATKAVSSGVIAGSGDLLCQYLLRRKKRGEIPNEHEATDGGGDADAQRKEQSAPSQGYDWVRTLRFFALGSVLVAPSIHAWYGFLMTRIPGTGPRAVMQRLVCDQGFFSPLFLPAFISCLTVLERLSPGDGINGEGATPHNKHEEEDLYTHLSNRLINDVPDIMLVNWSVWIPGMAIMFACVPSKFQVLYSNCIGFAWNAYLSWRTHEGEAGAAHTPQMDGNASQRSVGQC